jgi:hypothetical protein
MTAAQPSNTSGPMTSRRRADGWGSRSRRKMRNPNIQDTRVATSRPPITDHTSDFVRAAEPIMVRAASTPTNTAARKMISARRTEPRLLSMIITAYQVRARRVRRRSRAVLTAQQRDHV